MVPLCGSITGCLVMMELEVPCDFQLGALPIDNSHLFTHLSSLLSISPSPSIHLFCLLFYLLSGQQLLPPVWGGRGPFLVS